MAEIKNQMGDTRNLMGKGKKTKDEARNRTGDIKNLMDEVRNPVAGNW